MGDTEKEQIVNEKPKPARRKWFKNGCVLLLAVSAGWLYSEYVSTLHENFYHFSHLSDLEREMTLRSEMGFYYSYYKTIVQEKPFIAGISKVMSDRLVEYPNEVNAFSRFNIHPEVLFGALYRYLRPWLQSSSPRACALVSRGDELPPVRACVGLADPALFYLRCVWTLAGVQVAALLLTGYMLSGSAAGGVLSAALFASSLPSATRAHTAPAQREAAALPLLLLQALLLQLQLRARATHLLLQVSLLACTCLCLVCWQLSLWVLSAQLCALFALEQLRVVSPRALAFHLHAHFCALHMAVLLAQGSVMLKSSIYTSLFVVISTYCLFFSSLRIHVRSTTDLCAEGGLVALRLLLVFGASFYLKKMISSFLGAEEDDHVWELLLSKFTDYKSFHTLMYTCIDAFDFLPMSYFWDISTTLLLPLAIYGLLNHVLLWVAKTNRAYEEYYDSKNKKTEKKETKDREDKKEEERELQNTEGDSDDSGIENNAESATKKEDRVDLNTLTVDGGKNHGGASETASPLVVWLTCASETADRAVLLCVWSAGACGVMAALFMRLKALLTPQLCVLASLAVHTPPTATTNTNTNSAGAGAGGCVWARGARAAARGALLVAVGLRLYHNVREQLHYKGEFSDPALEQLLLWADGEGADSVWAGALPASAALLLSARRAIVAHPHYEHKPARERAYSVYKVYGPFTAEQLHEELSALRATHLVVETDLCYRTNSRGCSMPGIWSLELARLRGAGAAGASTPPPPPLCAVLLAGGGDAPHLHRVFANERYHVFRVHDLAVRYMPRVFDT